MNDTSKKLRLGAFHEAGHGVVIDGARGYFDRMTLNDERGEVLMHPSVGRTEAVKLRVLVAGRAAEYLVKGFESYDNLTPLPEGEEENVSRNELARRFAVEMSEEDFLFFWGDRPADLPEDSDHAKLWAYIEPRAIRRGRAYYHLNPNTASEWAQGVLHRAVEQATDVLMARWGDVEDVANALLKHRELTFREFKEAISRGASERSKVEIANSPMGKLGFLTFE